MRIIINSILYRYTGHILLKLVFTHYFFAIILFSAFLIPVNTSAQELKVSEFRKNITDISARENPVRDANGDVCSIIKARTGIPDLKVTSDLGIRKQEYREGEYWLWVSPGTSYLRFEGENFPVMEYKLPEFTEEYIVYVVLLTAIVPDRIEYRDISTVYIKTSPRNSDIYINDVFMGKSPLNVTVPDSTLILRAEHKRHLSREKEITLGKNDSIVNIKLPMDKEVSHFFIAPIGGTNKFGGLYSGLRMGTTGKTGFFLSFGGTRCFSPEIASAELLSMGDTLEVHYYPEWSSSDSLAVTGYKVSRFRISAGITRKIFNNTYLSIGAGYAQNDFLLLLNKYNSETGLIYGETISGKIINQPNTAGALYTGGLSYIIKDHLIVTTQANIFMKFKAGRNEQVQRFSYYLTDFNFGLGYIF